MKNTSMTLMISAALMASTYAGDDYSAKGGKEIIPPPPSCLWTWFAGGSAGEIDGDWDEEIYTLHVGVERKCPGEACSHAFFLEVGWTEKDTRYHGIIGDYPTDIKFECEVIPITLNYKYECQLSNKLNWYVGAGAGVALTDCKASITRRTTSASNSEDETVFYAHVFAGLVYNVNESLEVYGGVRHVFMDDPDFFSVGKALGEKFEIDGGIHYELGVRYNF